MAQEIERKFLVLNDAFRRESCCSFRIVQGYLSSDPERTVRVRIKGDLAYLTVKGASGASGISRFEWEKEISVEEAEELMLICESGIIEKVRYEIKLGQHTFEVDEFTGTNTGLVVAEIELQQEDETFSKPDWLGDEVTGLVKYYNSSLSRNPFANWSGRIV